MWGEGVGKLLRVYLFVLEWGECNSGFDMLRYNLSQSPPICERLFPSIANVRVRPTRPLLTIPFIVMTGQLIWSIPLFNILTVLGGRV